MLHITHNRIISFHAESQLKVRKKSIRMKFKRVALMLLFDFHRLVRFKNGCNVTDKSQHNRAFKECLLELVLLLGHCWPANFLFKVHKLILKTKWFIWPVQTQQPRRKSAANSNDVTPKVFICHKHLNLLLC